MTPAGRPCFAGGNFTTAGSVVSAYLAKWSCPTCSPPDCNNHGTCEIGSCVCDTGYDGAGCEQCAPGYAGYPLCVPIPDPPVTGDDVCSGGSNDGGSCSTDADCPGGVCGLKSRYVSIGVPASALHASGTIVADGGFEAGTPNPSWTEASTNFGTPLCDETSCGLGGGTGPRTGDWWSWFGGIAAPETSSAEQTVTIPSGDSATLDFWLEIPVSSGNGTDFLNVLLDGNLLFSVLENDPAYATYALVSLDISSFADGGSYLLDFESTISGSPTGTNFFVDDVSIGVTIASTDQTVQLTILDIDDALGLDAREGEVWWAGASQSISNTPNPDLAGAQLVCEASPSNAEAWPSGPLHLFGAPIAPGSTYEIRMCDASGANCSDPLTVGTGKWGDVVSAFGGGAQPNFGDITAVVDKFKELAGAPDMARTDLVSAGGQAVDAQANFADISAAVDGFKQVPYPYSIPACP